MTREHRFVHVDVFTDRVFGGNPLAVVVDGQHLADAEMQAIAREMNLSETTFLFPSMRADCAARVRIFTPARELPFAGHPTLGTAWVLATTGRLPAAAMTLMLEEGIGPVPVEFEGEAVQPRFVWMRHRDATFDSELIDRAAIAEALGLAEANLVAGAPIEYGSTGLPFVRIVSEQGTKMGRQSFVHIALRVTEGRIGDIRVGGSVVPVLEGRLTLP